MQRTGVLVGLIYYCLQLQVVHGQLQCNLPAEALECVKCEGHSFSECANSALRDICTGPNPICLTETFSSGVTGMVTKDRSCIPDASVCVTNDGQDFNCSRAPGSTVTKCHSCNFEVNDICVPNVNQQDETTTSFTLPFPETTTTFGFPPIPIVECSEDQELTVVNFNNLDFIDVSVDGEPSSREEAQGALQGSLDDLDLNEGQTFVMEFDSPVVLWQVNFTVTGASQFLMTCFDKDGKMIMEIPGQTSFPAGQSMVFIHAPDGEFGTKKIVLSFPLVADSGEFSIWNLRSMVCVKICHPENHVNYNFDNSDNFKVVISGENDGTQDKDILAGSGKRFGIDSDVSISLMMSRPTGVISIQMASTNADFILVRMTNQMGQEVFSAKQPGGGALNGDSVENIFGLSVSFIQGVTNIDITVETTSVTYSIFDVLMTVCKVLEPCICRVRGDPILEPCEGGLKFLSGQDNYMLASSPVSGCKWDVSVQTHELPTGVVIPFTMTIDAYGYKLVLDRAHNLEVNGSPENTPWSNNDAAFPITCEMEEDKFLVCTIVKCDAQFGFWGKKGMSEGIMVIPESVLSQVSGACTD